MTMKFLIGELKEGIHSSLLDCLCFILRETFARGSMPL